MTISASQKEFFKLISRQYNTYIKFTDLEIVSNPIPINNNGKTYIQINPDNSSRFFNDTTISYQRLDIADVLKDTYIVPDNETTLHDLLPTLEKKGIYLTPDEVYDAPLNIPTGWDSISIITVPVTVKNDSWLYYGNGVLKLGAKSTDIFVPNVDTDLSYKTTIFALYNNGSLGINALEAISITDISPVIDFSPFRNIIVNNTFTPTELKSNRKYLFVSGTFNISIYDISSGTTTSVTDNTLVLDKEGYIVGFFNVPANMKLYTGEDDFYYIYDVSTGNYTKYTVLNNTLIWTVVISELISHLVIDEEKTYYTYINTANPAQHKLEQKTIEEDGTISGPIMSISMIDNSGSSFSNDIIPRGLSVTDNYIDILFTSTSAPDSNNYRPYLNNTQTYVAYYAGQPASGYVPVVRYNKDGSFYPGWMPNTWDKAPSYYQTNLSTPGEKNLLITNNKNIIWYNYSSDPFTARKIWSIYNANEHGILQPPSYSTKRLYLTTISLIEKTKQQGYVIGGFGKHSHGNNLSTAYNTIATYSEKGELKNFKIVQDPIIGMALL